MQLSYESNRGENAVAWQSQTRQSRFGSKAEARTPGGRPRSFEDIAQRARDLCPLAIERLRAILRDPKSKDGSVIRAAELLLERGYGKAPAFHTNDPGQFRDVLEMSDAQIRDRLGVLRGLLIEHGIDPLALPNSRGNGGKQ